MSADLPPRPRGDDHHQERRSDAERTHEPDHVSARSVLIVGGIMAAVVAGSMLFLIMLQGLLTPSAEQLPPAWQTAERPPVEFDQPAQLRRLRRWEAQVLTEYGWQDDEQTIARIPVERAMAILAEQGFPFQDADLPSAAPSGDVEPRTDPAAGEESPTNRPAAPADVPAEPQNAQPQEEVDRE
jgi:hypothetical protein